MDNEAFFAEQTIKSLLEKYKTELESTRESGEFESERNKHLSLMISGMIHSPQDWDENCRANIKWIGKNFLTAISNTSHNSKENTDSIFSYCYRFLFELYLSTSGEFTPEFEAARKFGIKNLNEFSEDARLILEYAITQMPISLFKRIFSSEHIKTVRRLVELQEGTSERENKWKAELEAKEERVKLIQKSLDRHEKAFNFVGLHQGFDNLSKQKNQEKNSTLTWLKIFGALIFLPAIFELTLITTNINDLEKAKNIMMLSAIPALSATALLIYYFRILLSNYKSTTSQLLQLDLRKTLCTFIQDYANYSSEIKQKDKDSLAKFENIIFSGLVSDDSKIPSTFDGLEQISSLVKSMRSQ